MKHTRNTKLRIIAKTHGHEFEIGDKVNVTAVSEHDYRVAKNKEYWYVKEHEVESFK